jgi:Skp family chaperone for outer membrane proteins
MIKKVLLLVVVIFITQSTTSQNKNQKVAYVDMEYILENIPDYAKAQTQLENKVNKWKGNLAKISSSIKTMKADLSNEKALLTDDLIAERLEDISIKEDELKNLESSYFSSNGNLFLLRKQLVKPIQDQVYNAVQEIGKVRRYDIILDKSSDLIMLYTNKNADISELVLSSIVRGEKVKAINEKRNARQAPTRSSDPNAGVDGQADIDAKNEERDAKRVEALNKIEDKKAERLKKREDQLAEIEKKRLERLKKRDEVRKQLEENKKEKENSKEENEDDNNKN